jgi:hypothetical protein
MADVLLSLVMGGAGGVLTVGALHIIRTVGNPMRMRRRAALPPLDMSQYRVPPQE